MLSKNAEKIYNNLLHAEGVAQKRGYTFNAVVKFNKGENMKIECILEGIIELLKENKIEVRDTKIYTVGD